MSTDISMRRRRRSTAVPLSIVPMLAAAASAASCGSNPVYDPCEPSTYMEAACDSAVAQHGYWYRGTWYPHAYQYAALYYYSRHNSFLAGGGRVRTLAPTVYVPHVATPSRANVVRGGFGTCCSGCLAVGVWAVPAASSGVSAGLPSTAGRSRSRSIRSSMLFSNDSRRASPRQVR